MSKNVSPLVADMREYLIGQDKTEGGIAAMSIHLVDVLNSIMSCEASEPDMPRDVFKVREYVTNPYRNADGSESKVQQGLRNTAMMTTLFGFEAFAIPDNARSARDKALPAAIALDHYFRGADGKLMVRVEPTFGSTGGKRNVIGGIPAADMFDLVDDKGALTSAGKATLRGDALRGQFLRDKRRLPKDDGELTSYMLTYEVSTSGQLDSMFKTGAGQPARTLSTSRFLSDLRKRAETDGVLIAKPRNRKSERDDSGTDIDKSTKLLVDWVGMMLTPDGEAAAAPSPEREAMMDKLAEAWAAYRCQYPRGLV